MKKLVESFNGNHKVAVIKPTTIPSLEDEIKYKSIFVIVQTKRNLFEWAKGFEVKPTDNPNLFDVQLLMAFDPKETLLKDIYNAHKTKEWQQARYGHDKSYINVRVNVNEINQIVNWLYSTLN